MTGIKPIFRIHMLRRLRDRRSLAWTLIFPILVVSLFSMPFLHGGPMQMTVGVVDLDRSPTSFFVVAGMIHLADDVDVMKENSLEDALQNLKAGKVDVVIVLPSGLHEFIQEGENRTSQLTFDVYYRSGDAGQEGVIDILIEGMEAKINHDFMGVERGPMIVEGHALEEAPWGLKQFIVPLSISLVLLYGGMYYTSNTAAYLKESGGLRWLLCTPNHPTKLTLGIVAADGTMTVISTLLAVFTGMLLFSMGISISSLLGVILIVVASSYCLSLIGCIVGWTASNQTSSQTLAGITSAILAFSTIATLLPFSLPSAVIELSRWSPLTPAASTLRMLLLYGHGVTDIFFSLGVILLWFAVLFCLILVRHTYSMQNNI